MTAPDAAAYAALLGSCGLGEADAARLHRVPLAAVRAWAEGRCKVPTSVVAELHRLHRRMERAAEAAVAHLAGLQPRPEVVELSLAGDDRDAQSLGWPCRAVHAAVLDRVVARLAELAPDLVVAVVPRGSTPATRAAASTRSVAVLGARGREGGRA